MRISHIELLGFKSFVEKTRIVFDKGITVVVGPNGCGKSNVVDAMRWVMGELSAKSLRGSEMLDVIFSGSEHRKPVSLAQVAMTFSCDDGVYPPGYDGVAEIEIMRRLYRSGESEYHINRTPCRLKDIQELLMDTGIGAKTYAIVEQGQIAKILSAKPTDRRFLIEEAAGITKYRVRREETERKIEGTRQNLERVSDVIGEIRRLVNSLARQAGKARRYREYADELRAVDLELTARERAELIAKQAEAERLLAELRERIEQSSTAIAAQETSQEARHLEHLKAAKDLEGLQAELAALKERIHASEEERGRYLRAVAEEQARLDTIAAESEKAVGSIPDQERQAEEASAEARENATKLDDGDRKLRVLNESLTALRAARREHGARADRLRAQNAESSRGAAALEGRIEALENRRSDDGNRLREIGIRAEQISAARAESDVLIDANAGRLAEWRESLGALTRQSEDRVERMKALREENERRRATFEELRAEARSTQAELESLERMRDNLEGYSDGVKSLLSVERETGSPARPSILGLLGDMLEVPPAYETAVEAVLGDRVQGVLLKDQSDAMSAADFLKRGESGRSTFIPMQVKPARGVYPERTLVQTQGPLGELVSCRQEYAPVIGALLDDVLLVDDLPTAVRLHNENGYTGAFVTVDGEYVDAYGIITGGSKNALTSGIIEKNRRIRELRDALEARKAETAEAEKNYLYGVGLLERLEEEQRALHEELDRARGSIAELEAEARRLSSERAGLEAEAVRLVEQSDKLRAEQARRGEEIAAARRDAEALRAAAQAARDELAEVEQRLRSGSTELDELQNQVTTLTAELAGLRERHKAAMDRETRARWALTRIQEDMERRRGAVDAARSRIGEQRAASQAVETALAAMAMDAAERQVVIGAARQAIETLEQELAASDARLRVMRRDVDGLTQELSRREVSGVEFKMRLEALASRVLDKYGLDIETLPAEFGDDDAIDTAPLAERRRELSERLAAMGEVNVSAIEEHEAESKRLSFYETQKADLETALADLEKAIAKINKESKTRFLATFELVAARFGEVIPMLFGGGKAQMELTDPENPLESGIEISVRPPGKKLTTLNLLSGGEKALSSIGLIFAIFLIKPSPFCLLDEVDAPLDDANIDRFNELIEKIRAHSQVILITHNKRTMKIAETLYGVSMQEPGVSQLVSVRFEDEDETRPARTESPQETVLH